MPSDYTRRVQLVLEALSQNPVPAPEYDVRKLAGMQDTYRIRLGEIRIEYAVDWESRRIGILAAEFRERAYS